MHVRMQMRDYPKSGNDTENINNDIDDKDGNSLMARLVINALTVFHTQ